jgi:hypothetical protein
MAGIDHGMSIIDRMRRMKDGMATLTLTPDLALTLSGVPRE